MKTIWKTISYLGLDGSRESLNAQVVILNNRINFLVGIFMLGFFIILRIENLLGFGNFGLGSLGVSLLFLLSALNLLLSSKSKTKTSRALLVFLAPFLFIILPLLLGFVEEEAYVYDPYAIISLSVLIPLLILPSENKILYILGFIYYFLLVIFIDSIITRFAPVHFPVKDRIDGFYFMYKLSCIAIFLFVNLCVIYLRNINVRFENELKQNNAKLDQQNEELKSALEALKTNQQQLIASEKMASLGTLTAGIAHEINNPLNFISGGLNIIEDIKQEQIFENNLEIKESLETSYETIRAGVDRATKIVHSLIAFAYSGNPGLVLTDVHDIIENALLFLNSRIQFRIEVRKNFHLGIKVPVYVDLLHQIVFNIIDNAIYELLENSPLETRVIVLTTEETMVSGRRFAILKIANNGRKISQHDQDHIFDPFFTTKNPGDGTGLGLSIAFSHAKKHKGSIEVRNMEEGVEFLISLPIDNPDFI